MKRLVLLIICLLCIALPSFAQTVAETDFGGLKLRGIGPAFTSGRIADIAMHPDDDNVWYAAVGSGGVWKTVNAGVTWKSLFDGQGSYSIGAITLDPSNPHIVWVGTGENVGGRHVGYGDGIYRSPDGGKSWTNMGLKESEHISRIIVHPDDSDVVWVAAQGPLWSSGGDRGLYKTTDGGSTWNKTLGDDEWVGVTDLVMDPRNPDVLYAATWQRHRNVASYMGGGPGSGVHRSIDGGETWMESTKGIPSSNLGKIGLAISPQNPDNVYAAIELDRRTGGIFMSRDRGASWSKMSDTVSGATGPHYYQELYASPHSEGRLYLMDVRVQISEDHGATFRTMSGSDKHVDNHAIAFRADDPDYILMGTDGGLFETLDGTITWRFISNLSVTQYYKVAVDDALPFYHVYGGTQDNGSHGGPSRTINEKGIRNADWFKTLGADGHQSATEPGNPNIIYAETQQGGLHRVDRITGEQVRIQPIAGAGEKLERYNWDAPIVVSPHDPATLYFGSYRVWKSTNRGDSWEPVSGDLTRDQERFELPIMGRVQSWDNAWDLNAMSLYNTITSISESPVATGLLYVGTDDGLLHVSEDDGSNWRSMEVGSLPNVPATAFVNHVYADMHDSEAAYAVLDNHKFGDFSPYVLKSTDRGNSWTSIANNLPDRELVWRIVQDHVDQDLLFLAAEFGIFFSVDGGMEWIRLKGDAPTISFRDITIQQRENDLVAASFGRGFYVLDDYSSLRDISEELLAKDAHLFTPRKADLYVPRDVDGNSQGSQQFTAPNPEYGATFTYYLRESSTTLKEQRKEQEKSMESGDIPFPGWDALDAEINEIPEAIHVVVLDERGEVAGRVKASSKKGIHRVSWDLRYPSKGLIVPGRSASSFGGGGALATPGTYTATLVRTTDGQESTIAGPVEFEVVTLLQPALEGASPEEIYAFRKEVEALQGEVAKLGRQFDRQLDMVSAMMDAHARADNPDAGLTQRLHEARAALLQLQIRATGYESKRGPGEENPPSVQSRIFSAMGALRTTYGPTPLHRESVAIGTQDLTSYQGELDEFISTVMEGLASDLAATGAPPIDSQ